MTSVRLFPGLLSFGTRDAGIFFGREKEITALLAHIERDPVVIVNGLSGCGKSSLVKAGVIPGLLESKKLVIYTSVFENIIEDVLLEVRRTLGAPEIPQDYVVALQELYRKGPAADAYRFERAHSSQYNMAAIRNLLRDAFTAKGLERFCLDRDTFQPLLSHFGPSFSFEEMIDVLLTYCQMHVLFAELLSEIAQANPRQYERHYGQVYGTVEPLGGAGESQPAQPNVSRGQWQPGQPIVLIVDQVEQALRPSHPQEALAAFVKGISRLLRQAERFVTVVIVLRADWLYYLETSVRRYYPRLNVYSFIFTLDPLTREAAREAITNPLLAQGITYDEEIVADIVDSLQTSSVGPSAGPYVQPIQLQMVLRALSELAEDRGSPAEVLTKENYQQSGGVESILRNYLTNSLGSRSEAWRLLARFVAHDGKTGQTIRRTELLSVPAAEDVELELGYLIHQGFVEAFEAEETDEAYYRLAHDYLVDAIVDYLNKNPDQQGWKLAEDWLASGTLEWQASTRLDNGDGLLLEKNRYLHIYEYRDRLKLTDHSQRLLLLTSLRDGHEGLCYWLSRGANAGNDVEIVADKLLSAEQAVQDAARTALASCVSSSDGAISGLGEAEHGRLRERLWEGMGSPTGSAEQVAAARALWTLSSFDSARDRLGVGSVVLRRWAQDHSLQIASYLGTAILVMALLLGALFVRERLRGEWYLFDTLKAGPIPLIAVDPGEADAVYVVTAGGRKPREGFSLFTNQGTSWEAIRYSISKANPTSMQIVEHPAGTRFYITLYGEGILRSQDGGLTWELINRGLPSYGLTSLVADPDDPDVLFAGTTDWRGVLSSSDGGDSWQFYDYRGEILGAMITELVATRANGGALIAGTQDGRILVHPRDSTEWEARFGLPKGPISVLEVAKSDDTRLYAGTHRGIILRSQDGGESWQVLGQIPNQFGIGTIAISPLDPDQLYVSAYGNGGRTVWESQDAGQTWVQTPGFGLPRVGMAALEVVGQRSHWLVAGTGDGLFTSRDGGSVWEKEPLGAPLASVLQVAVSEGSSAPVYAVVGGSVFTNPEGDLETWLHGKGLQAEVVRTVAVDPYDPNIAYAGVLLLGEWSIYVTRDGGLTWQQTTPPPIGPVVPDTMALALAKTQAGRTVLYAGTLGCGILKSADEGQSWETFGRTRCDEAGDGNMPSDVRLLAVDAGTPDVVYAATGQILSHSTDGGHTWEQRELDLGSPIMAMVADPVEPNVAYLVAGSGGFWRTTDGGETWAQTERQPFGEAELTAVAAMPAQAAHLVVGASNGGVWVTADGGDSWRSIRENLAISQIKSIATSRALEGRIIIGSLSEGIALFTPGELLSSGP